MIQYLFSPVPSLASFIPRAKWFISIQSNKYLVLHFLPINTHWLIVVIAYYVIYLGQPQFDVVNMWTPCYLGPLCSPPHWPCNFLPLSVSQPLGPCSMYLSYVHHFLPHFTSTSPLSCCFSILPWIVEYAEWSQLSSAESLSLVCMPANV